MGNRGFSRGCEVTSRRSSHYVSPGRWRLGYSRVGEDGQEWSGRLCPSYWRLGLVGQTGRQTIRKPLLEPGEGCSAEAVTAARRSLEERRFGWSRFFRGRKP